MFSLAFSVGMWYYLRMELNDVKDVAVYGTDCIVDVRRGNKAHAEIVSAKEKYFDVKLDGGALTVTQKSRNLFSRIIMPHIELKIVLPQSFRGKLRLRNKNGGLYLCGGEFASVELSTKNGKYDVSDMSCDKLSIKMSNGNISLKKAVVASGASIKCSNGSVRVESVTSPELGVSCANATLTVIDVNTKRLDCSTSNGAIDASGIDADELRLETSNGRIVAAPIGDRDEYKLTAETSNGKLTVDGAEYKKLADVARLTKRLSAKTANGDIDIRFV